MADRQEQNPVEVIKQFRQDRNNKQLLNTLTNIVADPGCWECVRDEDIVGLFVDLILNQGARKVNDQDPFPAWLLPLQGLFNCMVGIRRSPGGFEDKRNQEVMAEYLSSCPQICNFLHVDGNHICRSEEHAEHIRKTLVSWVQAIWNGAAMMKLGQLKNRLKESRIITLTTWCWLYTTTPPIRFAATSALLDILEQPITSKDDLEQVTTACGSPERLVQAMNHVLSDEHVGEPLSYFMALAIALTGQTIRPELIQIFGTLNTTRHVLVALRRQIRFAEETTDDTWRIIDYSGMLIVNIVNDSKSPTEELTSLIANCSLIPLSAGLLVRFVQASKPGETWLSFVALLRHTCTCTSQSCRIRKSPEYLFALRTHLSWRWWPTLKRLHTGTNSTEAASKIKNEWLLLGRAAGFKEEEEKQRHELGTGIQGCWSVDCLVLVDPCDPATNSNLRKCSACKKALYCSSPCQSRDWKDHKGRCAVWKAVR